MAIQKEIFGLSVQKKEEVRRLFTSVRYELGSYETLTSLQQFKNPRLARLFRKRMDVSV